MQPWDISLCPVVILNPPLLTAPQTHFYYKTAVQFVNKLCLHPFELTVSRISISVMQKSCSSYNVIIPREAHVTCSVWLRV